MSRIENFEVVAPPPGVAGDCWLYLGQPNGKGYGPHRESYEARVGPIRDGLVLDHRCRRRLCLNPEHLEPVTQSINEKRKPLRARVARGDVCPNGHELVGANRLAGSECRTCNEAKERRRP